MTDETYNKARELLDQKDYTNAIIELKNCMIELMYASLHKYIL